jgi:hypothetical protein
MGSSSMSASDSTGQYYTAQAMDQTPAYQYLLALVRTVQMHRLLPNHTHSCWSSCLSAAAAHHDLVKDALMLMGVRQQVKQQVGWQLLGSTTTVKHSSSRQHQCVGTSSLDPMQTPASVTSAGNMDVLGAGSPRLLVKRRHVHAQCSCG